MNLKTTRFTRARQLVLGAMLACAGAVTVAAQAPAGGGGTREGISVHGHWEIVVRNPDGSLAVRREFENALVPSPLLPWLLQGLTVPGRWVIAVTGVCGTGTSECYLTPLGSTGVASPDLFETLTVTDVPAANSMQLFGSFTVPSNGSIQSVGTTLVSCGTSTTSNATTPAPAQCLPMLEVAHLLVGNIPYLSSSTANTRTLSFTRTSITPIALTLGQIVQVRVTISFS